MSFADWQPIYAERGVSTFPVHVDASGKRPMVRNYLRAGRPYSAALAKRFPDAAAFGFALGARSKITVLDCDSSDEGVLADAMSRHGKTPFVVRSGSGHFQAWYRHNGERRHVRHNPALPIDILGGGYVVAPPSVGTKSPYEIIAGSLDDLDRLPPLENFIARPAADVVATGRRNTALWEHCMRQCRSCDDFSALLDVAETYNTQSLHPPLTADEVAGVARSAWSITERGENRFGQIGVFLTFEETMEMAADPHLLTLLAWLRGQNSPTAKFLIADGLAAKLGWSLPQLRRCRRTLLEMGKYEMIRPPTRGNAALYRWLDPKSGNGLSKSVGHAAPVGRSGLRAEGELLVEDILSKSVGHCQSGPGLPAGHPDLSGASDNRRAAA